MNMSHKLSALQLLKLNSKSTSGFTFTELLVAVSITGIMMSLAGFGIVATLRANQRMQTEIGQRANLNRALDFVSDEIRMARTITNPATSPARQSCGTTTDVLSLTMPDNSNVIYYVHNLTGCSSSIWSRPATLRRVVGSDDNILVDAIIAPSTVPSCSTSSPIPGGNGFYACIVNNRSATLYLYGDMSSARSANNTAPFSVTSQVSARSF
jgi:prepilin-type N-terminal cleavage/methylation domain-containing protein